VFVDEINSLLDGYEVYDAFLSPLEKGVYVRNGHLFGIKPCVWFFAGTRHPAPVGAPASEQAPKASDFVSRLTLQPVVEFDVEKDDEKFARLEKVYLGVANLRFEYPDVRKVSKKVLSAFHLIRPATSIRDLSHFVKAFKDIQYGKVLAKNVPRRYFAKLGVDAGTWEASDEGPLVTII